MHLSYASNPAALILYLISTAPFLVWKSCAVPRSLPHKQVGMTAAYKTKTPSQSAENTHVHLHKIASKDDLRDKPTYS
eukprot:110717-Amphidinium_carterae.2